MISYIAKLFQQIWSHIRERPFRHCPKCGGRLESAFDPSEDRKFYICTQCYKEWIL